LEAVLIVSASIRMAARGGSMGLLKLLKNASGWPKVAFLER
jgi:hypothetical protein